jgi:hypothetical protein
MRMQIMCLRNIAPVPVSRVVPDSTIVHGLEKTPAQRLLVGLGRSIRTPPNSVPGIELDYVKETRTGVIVVGHPLKLNHLPRDVVVNRHDLDKGRAEERASKQRKGGNAELIPAPVPRSD